MIIKKYLILILLVAFSLNVSARFQSKLGDELESSIKIIENGLGASFEALQFEDGKLFMVFYDYDSLKEIGSKRRLWTYSYKNQPDVYDGKNSNLTALYFEFDCIDSRQLLHAVFYEGSLKEKILQNLSKSSSSLPIFQNQPIIPGTVEEYIQNKICR